MNGPFFTCFYFLEQVSLVYCSLYSKTMQKSQISLILPCRMYFTLFTILEKFIMFKLKRHIICHWYFYHTYIKKSSDASFTSYASLIFVNFDVASGSSVLSGCLKQKEEVKVIMNLTKLFEWIHISKIIILHNIMYNYLNSMTLQENDGGQIKKKWWGLTFYF